MALLSSESEKARERKFPSLPKVARKLVRALGPGFLFADRRTACSPWLGVGTIPFLPHATRYELADFSDPEIRSREGDARPKRLGASDGGRGTPGPLGEGLDHPAVPVGGSQETLPACRQAGLKEL